MKKKQILMNIGLILILALIGYYCFVIGKAHNIFLENIPYTVGSTQYEPIEAIQVIIDGEQDDPIYMLADDHMTATAIGLKHHITMELLDADDKVIETKSFSFTVKELGPKKSINIPAAYALGKLPPPPAQSK